MNDTNTNKADDMNEDDVTLTGPEGENTVNRGRTSRAARRPGRHGNRIPGCRRSERFDDGTGQRAVLHRLRRRR